MTNHKGDRAGKGSAQNGAEAAPNIAKDVVVAADYEAACGFLAAGKLAKAEAILRQVLMSDPDHVGAHNDLGVICSHRGEIGQAVDHFEKAIELAPDSADAYTNLGNLYHAAGRFDESAKAYRKAVTLDPRDANIQTDLGNSLQALGRAEAAAASYRRALVIEPEHLLALNNLGTVLPALGHADEAVASFRRALMIDPDFTLALGNLGNLLHIQGKLADAEDTMRRAVEAEPGLARAHGNLGALLLDMRRYGEAEECINRALEIDPGYAMAYSTLGALLRDMGRFEEAEESLTRALEIDPGYAMAKNNFAHSLLVQGDFGRAWPYYTARQSMRRSGRHSWQRPLPEDLHGKRILLLKDQGLGDEIFFLRFAPEVKRRGGEITYFANPKIASIIARLPFIDNIAGEGKAPRGMDITLSAGDLPLVLAMRSAADIPPPYPLPVEPDRSERMAARLKGLGPPPYVGVTWRAGTMNRRESLFKEAPLADLGRTLRPLSATVLVLQRNPEAGEIDEFSRVIGREAHDLTVLNDDLEDMLAALSLLDEYVTVSNTNVHLRAGAGKTSRVLIPRPPEWRWMAAGDESPWFPGCPVYRQKLGGDWGEAFATLARDLLRSSGP